VRSRSIVATIAALIFVLVGVAFAQGFGEFVSPGRLAAPHAKLEGIQNCTQCHSLGAGVSATACMECHTEVRQQVQDRQGFHADKGRNCQECHPDHRGREFELVRIDRQSFDHSQTGFPLRGEHARAACTDCHTSAKGDPSAPTSGGEWKGLATDCLSCHGDESPHRGAPEAGHALLSQCDRCHDVRGWEHASPIPVAVFDHANPQMANFPLEGRHRTVACERCHADWRFAPIAHGDCASCHKNPHHADFERACESCHATPSGWKVASFDHSLTDFPLVGEHAAVECEECHTGRSRLTPVPHDDCDACHEDPHDDRFEPTPCLQCHSPTSWDVGEFDHSRTDFPLEGAHAKVECDSCHLVTLPSGETQRQFSGRPHDTCTDCHESPHGERMAPESCTTCHNVQTWTEVAFDHARDTGFRLEPQHTDVACEDCHASKVDFTLTRATLQEGVAITDCRTCHEIDRPDPHYAGTCETCHRAAKWYPAGLGDNPHAVTGFPLRGEHATLACEDCHQPGHPQGEASSVCADCHATDDPHKNLLGRSCDDCHEETTWLRVDFHHDSTGFPLRGAHRLAACWDCHAIAYAGTPTDCWRCHEATAPLSIPAHQSAFFPECDSCHRTYSWTAISPRTP
jgi:hypothetical protein